MDLTSEAIFIDDIDEVVCFIKFPIFPDGAVGMLIYEIEQDLFRLDRVELIFYFSESGLKRSREGISVLEGDVV